MQLTVEQFEQIAPYFPKKRGKLSLSDYHVFNTILFVAVNGCKWRALPKVFGNWHTIYTRMNRWAKKGFLDRIFIILQEKSIIKMKLEVIYLDSTSIKLNPHGTGALKKTDLKALAGHVGDGQPSFIWLPRVPKEG